MKKIGRDYLAKVVRENGLNVWRRKRRRPKTTYSKHSYVVQPNLFKESVADAPNQILVADITYLHIGDAFGYLFLITDIFSRLIVGYHLSESLAHEGAIIALMMALKKIQKSQGSYSSYR